MAEIILPEWRNGNSRIKYPFSDRATLVNNFGKTISPHLFLDARIYPIGGKESAYLSRIRVVGFQVTFFISDENGTTCSGTYFANSTLDIVELRDLQQRPAGVLVSSVETLAAVPATYGAGDTDFLPDQTPFVASVVVPMPDTLLTGIELPNKDLVTGEVWLVGTDGIVLSAIDSNTIRVDVVGDPYAKISECQKLGIPPEPFCGIRTIGGIPPDSRGDWKITTGTLLSQEGIIRIDTEKDGEIKLKLVGII